MKVTKRKLDKISYKHYKTVCEGSLIPINGRKNSSTSTVIEKLSFEKSMRDKIIKFSKPKSEDKAVLKRYNIIKHFVSYMCGVDNTIIDEKKLDEFKTIFKAETYTGAKNSVTRKEVISYSFTSYGAKFNVNDIDIIGTFDKIVAENLTLQETLQIIEPFKTKISDTIANRKKHLKNSIEKNKFTYIVENNELKCDTKFSVWLENKLMPTTQNIDTYNINNELDILIGAYKVDDFVESIKTSEYYKNEKMSCSDIKRYLTMYEKTNLIFNKDTPEDLRYIIIEVRNYIARVFPLKKINESKKREMFIYEEKEGKNPKNTNCLKKDYINMYINTATISNTIKEVLKNKLNNLIIAKGKLIHYYYINDNNNPHWQETEFTSTHLEEIKLRESVKKQMFDAVTIARLRLEFILNYNEDTDLLDAKVIDKEIQKLQGDLNLRNECKERLKYFFEFESLSDEELYRFIIDLFYSINNIRIGIFHYDRKDIFEVFKYSDLKNTKTEEIRTCGLTDFKDCEDITESIIKNSFEKEKSAILEQLLSMNFNMYFNKGQLKQFLDKFEFGFNSVNIPFTPSFKNVYEKGYNIQNSKNNLITNANGWYVDLKNRQYQLVYKNLLQLIFKNDFLNSVVEDERIITSNIAIVIKQNKDNASTGNRFAFKYSVIPNYRNENLGEYFAKLQSIISTTEEEKQEVIFDFIRDLYAYSFNSFLNANYDKNLKNLLEIKDEAKIKENNDFIKNNLKINNKNIDKNNYLLYCFLYMQNNESLNNLKNQFIKLKSSQNNANADNLINIISYVCAIKTDLNNIDTNNIDTIKYFSKFIDGDVKKYSCNERPLYYHSDGETEIMHKSLELIKMSGILNKYEKVFDGYKVNISDYRKWVTESAKIEDYQNKQRDLHKKWVDGEEIY